MSIQDLYDAENFLATDKGKAFLCERVVYRGQDLHNEVKKNDWFNLFLLGVTGKEYSEDELKLLNYIWVCTSYPDPSIWPNHVTALAASTRSTASLSILSGLSISEATLYGRRPDKKSIDFFLRAGCKFKSGEKINEIVDNELSERKVIFGYGRPLVKLDERVVHLVHYVKKLKMDGGLHFNIALDIYRYLKSKKGLSINVAALAAALAADLGMTPEQYHLYLTPCFMAGMVPCYIDAIEKKEGAFFPVRCKSVVYSGVSRRKWV